MKGDQTYFRENTMAEGDGGFSVVAAAAAKSHQSYPTLCDPMDCSLPGSSVHGILQARILEWVAISSSRVSSQPRVKSVSFTFPVMAGKFFTHGDPCENCRTHFRIFLWLNEEAGRFTHQFLTLLFEASLCGVNVLIFLAPP